MPSKRTSTRAKKQTTKAASFKKSSKKPAKTQSPPPPPRNNLLVKRPAPVPEPQVAATTILDESAEHAEPKVKKQKKHKELAWVHILKGEEGSSTFDYDTAIGKERVLAALELKKLKVPLSTICLESKAEVIAEGKGYSAKRSVEGDEDWIEVENIVHSFVEMGRKQLRVLWITIYGIPSCDEDDAIDKDDILSGEEEYPTVTESTMQLPQYRQCRTATVLEKEKAHLQQASEKNCAPDLMARWRCTVLGV
ncbi:hypothetical protein K440DRAFT_261369 [Wilcoxina mikolae CBS 423.85]|nr:hypothetical protein K440DRAFT_261369 [Wilcoxina mikolae CBS 423.85]